MRSYNPTKAPPAREWLALSEPERLRLVQVFHEAHGEYGESLDAHCGVHAAVETQLAMKASGSRDALSRLRKQGLNRHEAIHAIGMALIEHLREAARGDAATSYEQKLANLDALDWRDET